MGKVKHGSKRVNLKRDLGVSMQEFMLRNKLLSFLEKCAQNHRNYIEDTFFRIYDFTKEAVTIYKQDMMENTRNCLINEMNLEKFLEEDIEYSSNLIGEAIMKYINKSFTSKDFRDLKSDTILFLNREYVASFCDYYYTLKSNFEGLGVNKEFNNFRIRQQNQIKKICAEHSHYIFVDFREELMDGWQILINEINKIFEGNLVFYLEFRDLKTHLNAKLSYKIKDSILEIIDNSEEIEDIEEVKDDYKYIDDYRQLNKLATSKGFTYERSNGDHGIYKDNKGRIVVIPQGRSIGKGLSLKIQKSLDYVEIV